MRLTESQLKQIIKEELQSVLREAVADPGLNPQTFPYTVKVVERISKYAPAFKAPAMRAPGQLLKVHEAAMRSYNKSEFGPDLEFISKLKDRGFKNIADQIEKADEIHTFRNDFDDFVNGYKSEKSDAVLDQINTQQNQAMTVRNQINTQQNQAMLQPQRRMGAIRSPIGRRFEEE